MGFRSARRSTSRESTASSGGVASHQQAANREQSTGAIWTHDIEQSEQHFEMSIPDDRTLQRLQMHESTFGAKVHDWIAEGMPTEITGKTRDMEAFRRRQADRPPEVPTNIERQNKRSVQRSEQAAAETGATGETGVPESVRDVISSTGRSLDASIQRAMEDRMGDSLGDVRIHTGPQAAAACEAINARAFTVGNHVAFNQGEYDPDSPEGQHVLAHELAHVRQQTGGAVCMLPQEDVELEVDPDPALEREAEEMAQRVMQGGDLGIQRLAGTEVHVQRAGLGSIARNKTYDPGNTEPPAGEQTGVQELLERAVSGAAEIDWISVFKKAGIEMAKLAPGVGTAASVSLAVADEIDGQTRADNSVTKGNLVEYLNNRQPPSNWVSTIADKAAKRVQNGDTGIGSSTGDARSRVQ